MSELADDGSDFAALMGAFGSHANTQKRAKAERMAALKKDDGRRTRKVTRPHQFNNRVDTTTLELTKVLAAHFSKKTKEKWSQTDVVIAAIAALAKAEKVGAGA